MFNLKKFLSYRDNYKEFDEIKKMGNVGLPFMMNSLINGNGANDKGIIERQDLIVLN